MPVLPVPFKGSVINFLMSGRTESRTHCRKGFNPSAISRPMAAISLSISPVIVDHIPVVVFANFSAPPPKTSTSVLPVVLFVENRS